MYNFSLFIFIKKIIVWIILFFYKTYPYNMVKTLKKIIYNKRIKLNLPLAHSSSFIEEDCYLVGGQYISIGENTSIRKHAVITAWDKYYHQTFIPQIEIGNNVIIGEYCHITSINRISIGNGVLTGRRVTITDNSHGNSNKDELLMPPIERPLYSKGAVVIDKNVWIGDKVTILPNVHIGEGCIIAANAVVTTDIPPYCIAAGIPAKIIKTIV